MKSIVFDKARVIEWVERKLDDHFPLATAIGLERDGELVAGVLYDRYNGASICMHVAADGSNWLTREFLFVAFAYPFNQLGCKRITGIVNSNNVRAQRFDEHLGFTLEARLKDAMPDGADMLIYRMLRDECIWIKGRSYENTELAA